MRHASRVLAAVLGTAVVGARVGAAQCPDGTPPPCRIATVALARRSADPPLDPRTWIVLPFDNVTHTSDVDWMRDASVNLLYLDLSRWQDIHVVDDERVADLLRDAGGPTAAPQSLNAGLTLAKHAGAGRLVMGDLLKTGSRVTVVAKVFDVASARRLRSVQQETTTPDSIMPLFSRLARGILAVDPPPGATVGDVGTTSVDAYQEYRAGVQLLNRFDLTGAEQRFNRALQLDSTFALAYFKSAMALLWDRGGDSLGRARAKTALRFSTTLPARERTLIRGLAQDADGDYGAMCVTLGPLVLADSSDVDAVAGMADCLYHDNVVLPVGGDTTNLRFRASINESLRLWRRVLTLDPTYLLAYQHFIDALTRDSRTGARLIGAGPRSEIIYSSSVLRDGDSLLTMPFDARRPNPRAFDPARATAYRANLDDARRIALEWLGAAPKEPRAHAALARVALRQGNLEEVRTHLALTAGITGSESERVRQSQQELPFRALDIAQIVRTADSLSRIPDTTDDNTPAAVLAMTGRYANYDARIARYSKDAPAYRPPYNRAVARFVTGAPIDTAAVIAAEATTWRSPLPNLPDSSPIHSRTVFQSLQFALRLPRTAWVTAVDTLRPLMRPAAALARGDTAGLRRAAAVLDSTTRLFGALHNTDLSTAAVAADAYLALRDTARALALTRWVLDTALVYAPALNFLGIPLPAAALIPRLMLLRADLETSAGNRAAARIWYGRVQELWAKADPELGPVMDRIKRALAAPP